MSTYPLATLALQITPSGISAPSYNDILLSLLATFKSIYGSDIYLGADSQDYQWIAALASAQNDTNNAGIAVFNAYSPTTAQGTGLSSIVKINGLQREIPTYSTVIVTIVGQARITINQGIISDIAGNLWDLPDPVIISDSGTIDVTATSQLIGAIAAPTNFINKIYTPTLGWQTVINNAAAVPGAPVESDATLRQRQSISTMLPSQTPIGAIRAAVANVLGVTRSTIYENDTAVTDANGIPSHSIAMIVMGGDSATVARVIEEKKSPGTGTYGTTNQLVIDPQGVPINIHFFALSTQRIFVNVTIKKLAGYVSATAIEIANACAYMINSLSIGEELYFLWMYGPAALSGASEGLTYRVVSLTIGLSLDAMANVDIPIAFNSAAVCAPSDVLVTVT